MTPPPGGRVVYVVLAHTDPAQLDRLVTRLLGDDPDCHVVVDHDARAPVPTWSSEARGPRLHVARRPRRGGWGGFGLVEATLAALRFSRERLDPDWVVLLSGQDYPTANGASIRDRLRREGGDAHLEPGRVVRPDGRRADAYAHARYFYRWFGLPHRLDTARLPPGLRRLALGAQHRLSLAQGLVFVWTLPRGAGTHVGFRRRCHPFHGELRCRLGSQWLALSRRGLAAVGEAVERQPGYVAHFRRSLIPDEAFFTSLVLADPTLTVHPHSPTYVRMAEAAGGAHPEVLGAGDLEAVLASGRCFARKVDSTASGELLAALDARAANPG